MKTSNKLRFLYCESNVKVKFFGVNWFAARSQNDIEPSFHLVSIISNLSLNEGLAPLKFGLFETQSDSQLLCFRNRI